MGAVCCCSPSEEVWTFEHDFVYNWMIKEEKLLSIWNVFKKNNNSHEGLEITEFQHLLYVSLCVYHQTLKNYGTGGAKLWKNPKAKPLELVNSMSDSDADFNFSLRMRQSMHIDILTDEVIGHSVTDRMDVRKSINVQNQHEIKATLYDISQTLMRRFDVDGDGVLSWLEFTAFGDFLQETYSTIIDRIAEKQYIGS